MIKELQRIQNEDRLAQALNLLEPKSVDAPLTRVGSKSDGGYVMIDHLEGGVVYSFGVGGNSWWDMVMESKGYHVYMYDHTVDGIVKDRKPYEVPEGQNLFFHKLGIGSKNTKTLRTVDQLIIDNGHEEQQGMILQCDIEGSEWDVFSNLSQVTLSKFDQILLEFHTLDRALIDDVFYSKMYRTFEVLAEQFIPFHVHGNNCTKPPSFKVNGKVVPTTLEVSFVNRDFASVTDQIPRFPTELDFPNRPSNPEIELGTFRWK